jgi:chaperone protein dnaK
MQNQENMNDIRKTMIIGIDFGTSTTVVKYKYKGHASKSIETLRDPDNTNLTTISSLIFYPTDDRDPYFGNGALIQHTNKRRKGAFVQNFKLGLNSNPESAEFKTSASIIKDYFKFLFDQISKQILRGMEYDDILVYVSVPAKWTECACDFMYDAFMDAGFRSLNDNNHKVVVEIVDEPTAALHYMLAMEAENLMLKGLIRTGVKSNILLLDMGAGTSDIVIFQITLKDDGTGRVIFENPENLLRYPSIDNPIFCGGSEVDNIFQKYLHDCTYSHFQEVIPNWNVNCSLQMVKGWKERISDDLKKIGEVTDLPSNLAIACEVYFEGKNKTVEYDQFVNSFSINRATFEQLTYAHWGRLNTLINEAVNKYNELYGISAKDIDIVLLTGGHSSWYCVEKLFNGEGVNNKIGKNNGFTKIIGNPGERIVQGATPSETVAEGLCMQDLDIKIPRTAANNVYIELVIDGTSSGIKQILKSGTELPCPLTQIETPEIIVTKSLYARHKFKVIMNIYEGSGIEDGNAIRSSKELLYNNKSVAVNIGRFFGYLLGGFEFPTSFKFKVVIDAEMKRNQRLDLKGNLIVDGKSKWSFTMEDFRRIENA